MSDLDFHQYILFFEKIAFSNRIEIRENNFQYADIDERSKVKIKKGLIEECYAKLYINDSDINENNIVDFLNKVRFVVNSRDKSEYIFDMIGYRLPPDYVNSDYAHIFEGLRDLQGNKKGNKSVEGEIIDALADCLGYDRIIKKNDVYKYIFEKIVNISFSKSIQVPTHFIEYIENYSPTRKKDVCKDCIDRIQVVICDENSKAYIYELLSSIVDLVLTNQDIDIENIYRSLDIHLLNKLGKLDRLQICYYIAIVLDMKGD